MLTLGFEQQTYMFTEPNPGTTQLTEDVCVAISAGSLGRDIAINVLWTPVTATGITIVNVCIRANLACVVS